MKLPNNIKRVSLLLVLGLSLFSCEHELFADNDDSGKWRETCLQRESLDSNEGTDRSNICPMAITD